MKKLKKLWGNLKDWWPRRYYMERLRALKVFNEGRGGTLLKLFLAYLLFLAVCTIGYKEIPLLTHYSLLGEETFYSGLITNLFSSAVDFLVFSIAMYFLLAKHDVLEKIRLYKDHIDDSRFLYTDEAAFRNAANIRRLQALGVNSLDLSKCTLKSTKIKRLEFADSRLMGACLDQTNLDGSTFVNVNFKGASAQGASMNNVRVTDGGFKNFDFEHGQMIGALITDSDFTKSNLSYVNFKATKFVNCDFLHATLTGCSLERADLRGAANLTVSQLLQCGSIKYAHLDECLADSINPVLLGRRTP